MQAEQTNNLKEHINNQIVVVGKAMVQDTIEYRGSTYSRKNFTIGALVAYDPEVRRLVSREGGNLRQFDEVIAVATQAILQEYNQSNPVGTKLIKVLKDAYTNGHYQ